MRGMTDGDIIKALGGYRVIAEKLGITPENALHFERRKIPWKYRRHIKLLAQRKKIALPDDFLDVQRSS